VFLVLYLIAGQFVSDLPNTLSTYVSGLIDPLATRTTTIVARYWTVSEKNSQVVAFSGLMAYNRLLWLALGAIATAVTFRFFPFSVEALVAGRHAGRAAADAPAPDAAAVTEVPVHHRCSGRDDGAQFRRVTRLRVALVLTGLPFWLAGDAAGGSPGVRPSGRPAGRRPGVARHLPDGQMMAELGGVPR